MASEQEHFASDETVTEMRNEIYRFAVQLTNLPPAEVMAATAGALLLMSRTMCMSDKALIESMQILINDNPRKDVH